jgi:hypothetical protein
MVKARYPSRFDLKDYDFFVIFVEVRSAEHIEMDNWLIDYIEQTTHKPIFLVLSKVDIKQ